MKMKMKMKGEGCLGHQLQGHKLKLMSSLNQKQRQQSVCLTMMNKGKMKISSLPQSLQKQKGIFGCLFL